MVRAGTRLTDECAGRLVGSMVVVVSVDPLSSEPAVTRLNLPRTVQPGRRTVQRLGRACKFAGICRVSFGARTARRLLKHSAEPEHLPMANGTARMIVKSRRIELGARDTRTRGRPLSQSEGIDTKSWATRNTGQ